MARRLDDDGPPEPAALARADPPLAEHCADAPRVLASLEWLNPIAALFLIWLSGAGVLVMRETAVRWKTGRPSILLVAAYGIKGCVDRLSSQLGSRHDA